MNESKDNASSDHHEKKKNHGILGFSLHKSKNGDEEHVDEKPEKKRHSMGMSGVTNFLHLSSHQDKKEKKERRRKSHEDPSVLVEKKQEPLKESTSDAKIQEPEKPQASSEPVQEAHSPTVPETNEIENRTPTETPRSSDDAEVEPASTVVTEPGTPPQTDVQPEVKKQSFKQAVKSKLEFEMEPKVEIDVKALVSSLLEPIVGVSFFTVGLLLAFIMGYFGFQLLWVLILIYVFHKMDSKLQQRIRRREFRKLLRERELEERARLTDPTRETVAWMNMMVDKAWKKAGPLFADIIAEKAKEAIQMNLSKNKPPVISDIVINEISLGTASPDILYMKAYPNQPLNTYKLDVELKFDSEIKVDTTIKMGAGAVAIPVPILVKDVSTHARANAVIKLANKMPIVSSVYLQFSKVKVDLTVQPLKMVGVLDLPLIHDWFCMTISTVLKNNPIKVQLIPDEDDDEAEAAKSDGIFSKIGTGFGTATKGITKLGTNTISAVGGVASGGVQMTEKAVGKLGNTTVTAVKTIGGGVTKIGTTSVDVVSDGFSSVGSVFGIKKKHKKKKSLNESVDETAAENGVEVEQATEEQQES